MQMVFEILLEQVFLQVAQRVEALVEEQAVWEQVVQEELCQRFVEV